MWSVPNEQKSSVIEAGKGKPRRVYGSGSIRSTNVSLSCLPHALSVKSEQFLRQPILDRILSLPVYSWSSHSFFGGGFDIYASVLLRGVRQGTPANASLMFPDRPPHWQMDAIFSPAAACASSIMVQAMTCSLLPLVSPIVSSRVLIRSCCFF